MKESKIMDIYIDCLSDYFKIINELDKEYRSGFGMNNPTVTKFLYRGISDITYKLLPNIFRELIKEEDELKIVNSKYLEYTDEKNILNKFKQEASAYITNIPSDKLVRWAELAQHYGVPTRFLDWTGNSLVGLYFACENNKDKDAAVWMLHVPNYIAYENKNDETLAYNREQKIEDMIESLLKSSKVNKSEDKKLKKLPFVYTPYYFDPRMSAQSSYFMVWGTENKPFEELINEPQFMEYNPPKDNSRVYSTDQLSKFVFKFCIRSNAKQMLLRQLETAGINAKTLFPGLDGIGKYIERKYRFDYDEACRNF